MLRVSEIERFADGVALHNRLVDEDEAQKEIKLISKYRREIWLKEHGKDAISKQANDSAEKVADRSWMTKEKMMAMWKAVKEKHARMEKEQTNTLTPKMSEKQDALRAVDTKILETMNYPKEKQQETVITRGVTPMAQSKAPIISQKITRQQQNAFHEAYASRAGLEKTNTKTNSKGYER